MIIFILQLSKYLQNNKNQKCIQTDFSLMNCWATYVCIFRKCLLENYKKSVQMLISLCVSWQYNGNHHRHFSQISYTISRILIQVASTAMSYSLNERITIELWRGETHWCVLKVLQGAQSSHKQENISILNAN